MGVLGHYWRKMPFPDIGCIQSSFVALLVPQFEKFTLLCLPIVSMAYQWLTFWPMVIYLELLWMFIIIFHIAYPCSLSNGLAIKHRGLLQYIWIYLEKCMDKKCMIVFKIEKPHIPWVVDYVQYLVSFTIWKHRQNAKCAK